MFNTRYIAAALALWAPVDDNDSEPLGIIELDDDLENVEKPKDISAGWYVAEVQDVKKKTSGAGNEYYAITFVVNQSELPPDVADDYPDGLVLYYNRVMVPTRNNRRALWRLKSFVQALGLSAAGTEIDPSEWMGCTAKVKISLRAFNGERQPNVDAVEAAEKAARAPSKRAPAEETEDAPPARRKSGPKQGARTTQR